MRISNLSLVRALRAVLLLLAFGFAAVGQAQTTYTNTATGNWSTTTSWTPNATLPVGGAYNATIQFSPSATDNSTNDLAGAFFLNQLSLTTAQAVTNTAAAGISLLFTNSGATQPLLTNASTGTLTLNSAVTLATNLTVGTAAGGSIVINSNLTDGGLGFGLTSSGAGTLTLGGANTYSGVTTISAGTVIFQGGGALPATTVITNLDNNATLQIANDGSGNNGTINLGNNIFLANASITNTINVGNNGTSTGNTVAFGALSFSPQNSATKSTINLNGANGYSVSFSSVLLAGNNGYQSYLQPTNVSVIITGNVTNQITFTTGGKVDTLNLGGASSGNAINGTIKNSSVFNNVTNGITAVTKNGTSTWALNGTNAYSGATTISGGTLTLGGVLSNSLVSVGSSGTFTENASGVIAGTTGLSSSGTVTLNGTNTYSGTTTITGGTLTLGGVLSNTPVVVSGGSGHTENASGVIAGTTGLTTTAATTTLSGINTYSGDTSISGSGKLLLSAGGSIANSPNIIVGSGGTFDVSGLTTALALGSSQTLKASATGANTTGTVKGGSSKGLTLSAGGLVFTAYGSATTTAPLTANGAAGVIALNSAPVTVNTTTTLAAGTYTLITTASSGTVIGSPGTLTVNGLASPGFASVAVASSKLNLTITGIMPSITGSATLTAFTTTYGTASAAQSFAVSGSHLVANLVATAPTGFEVSSDGSTYGSTASFTQTSGSASGTLYMRLAASATVSGSYNSQNIVLSSSGAANVSITTASTGNTVSAATPTVTPSWSVGTSFTYTSSGQGPTLTSVSTSPNSTGTTNVTYLGVSGTTYASSANAPTNVGSYSVTVTIGSDANNNSATASENFSINQTNLTVASQPNTKVYDGTTSATNKPTITAGSLQGSDVATLKEAYRNALVGAGKPLVPSIAITNAGVDVLANYNVTLVTNSTGVIQATTSLLLTNNIGETNNYGQTFVFTAVVQTNGVTVSSGASSNVVFSLGSTPVWTNALVNGLAYYTNNSLTVGVTNFTAQYLGDDVYLDSSVTVTQTVLQTTPNLTLTASAITYGDSLSSSSLAGSVATNGYNQASVDGSYAFADNSIAPNAGNTNVWVIFTPTDTTNYTTSSNTVNVTVNQASTFVGATSTNNPSGYKDPVAFTATLPAFASGDVVFSSTNGPISTNGLISGSATSLSVTNLPRGTNLITVAYLGDNNYAGSTNTLNQVVTNHPPVVSVMTVTRTAGLALIIALSDIATNWTDSDSDHVSLTGVTMQSTNGVNLFPLNWSTNLDGSIETTNAYAYIGYTNSPNVADQISYTISDGFGGTNIGYVNIVIQTSVTGTNSISGHDFTSPYSNTITAYGIPNFFYVLERATNLTSPVWVDVQTNQAATNGVINSADTFWDLGGVKPSPSAFYQLKWQP